MANMNTAFTGNLNIGGQSHKAGFISTLRAPGRLAIKNMPSQAKAAEMEKAPGPMPDSSENQKPGGIKENFEKSLLTNLQKNQKSETGLRSAQDFAGSISAAVDELKKRFGDEAANQAMAEILRATQGNTLSAEKIAGTFTNVMQGLTQKNTSALANENMGSAELNSILKSQKNLSEFRNFLNDGSAANVAASSLSAALNDYFPSANGASFQEDFSWGSQAAAMNAPGGVNGAAYIGPAVSIDDIGRENLADFINFLRTELDSESEAQYFENLSGSANFLTEIEELSDRFYFSDPEEEVPLTGGGGITIMVRQGIGAQKAEKLEKYADYELTDLINKTVKESINIRNRVVKGLRPDLAAQDWEFSGWNLTGSRAAMLVENHAGGQAQWDMKNFEYGRCEMRDKGAEALRFAEDEMKKRGLWKDEYNDPAIYGIPQDLFLQTLFDQGEYDGVGVGGLPFKNKEARWSDYLSRLNSGIFTEEERARAYNDYQKLNNGQLVTTII